MSCSQACTVIISRCLQNSDTAHRLASREPEMFRRVINCVERVGPGLGPGCPESESLSSRRTGGDSADPPSPEFDPEKD